MLIYNLPFKGVAGDIGLTDADVGPFALDYVRFNGDGTVIFYSDNLGGADALADTSGPPGSFYTNVVTQPEVGPEGNNGLTYTPTAGQPGYDASLPTYQFTSDSAVPEPGSMMLMGLGLAALALRSRRRRT